MSEEVIVVDDSGGRWRKRKIRSGERVFKFEAFGEGGYPVEFNGSSFLENLTSLLKVGDELLMESGGMATTTTWSFQLQVHRHPSLHHLFLFVVEEPIQLSSSPSCKHCQYIGWGHHLICNKKYHFVLPSKNTVSSCLSFQGRATSITSSAASVLESKCNLIELQGHSMHGVFHSNGFGHLLCINGSENGSDLPGFQLMDFWDRLCIGLRVRGVSLRDISQKRGMDLRLLHAITYGKPWFGQWGYSFGRGCFGVNQLMYQNAVEALQNLPLGLLAHLFGNRNNEILSTVSKYQILSGHSLATLSDLFHFMLELKSRLPRDSNKEPSNPGMLMDASCRWSPKRVDMAIRVIIEALKRAEFRWISRQEVRDAARIYIGDTGLLDFVLKSLGNHIVGKYLVRRCLNPVTKVLEYCLEDVSHALPKHDCYVRVTDSTLRPQQRITWAQLMKDLSRLYHHILKESSPMANQSIAAPIPVASTTILDSKYLIKDYSMEPSKFDKKFVHCSVVLICNSEVGSMRKAITLTPPESFALEKNTTFDELRLKVERFFRDLYWGMRNFVVQKVANSKAAGSDLVFMLNKESTQLVFEGEILGETADLGDIFENSDQHNVVVDCTCGTKSDDGERMVCCDICEVWQHTRCVQIPNHEMIPSIFLCRTCEREILHLPSLS